MVWFQCEDCGENLKKPKLQNHFWKCSASKLSCIDCGEIFGQESVQGHTQCITEAEKYGPKGQGKALNGNTARPQSNTKQKPEVDVNVGLSECPPWFCSLCNSKATSKQTLLLHADGKKHRAKARAFHASKQQPKQAEESAPNGQVSSENNQDEKLSGNVDTEQQKSQNPPKVDPAHSSFEAGNGSLLSSKKRKHEASKTDSTREMAGGDISGEIGYGEVIQIERAVEREIKWKVKKPKQHVTGENEVLECTSTKEDAKKRIKWKKLIKSALKSNPDKVLKMRKLRKLVLEAITQSGSTEDEGQLSDVLEQKINSSSRFTVQGKYVRLVGKN